MILPLAMLLDAALGEPKWLWDRAPHPAVIMGRIIGWADKTFNTGQNRQLKGVLVITLLIVAAWGVGGVIEHIPVLDLILAAILIAQKSLVEHVAAVAKALRHSLADGRTRVAMIVGRDVSTLDESGVVRSAIESAAENLSDGVIAPIFWYAVAGLPGMLAYKMINTADSMIGYRTPRHSEFGWAAARIDDLANWVPARLTAGLIILTHGRTDLRAEISQDAALHRSPNAGWPEAAMARVLRIALSGPRSYDGRLREEAFVNNDGRHALISGDIDVAISVLWRVWAVSLVIASLISLL